MTLPLSKTSEDKLLRSIDGICEELPEKIATARELTAAAVKQAQEQGFGPDMIRLMCHGWNNGAVNHQRERSTGILEKHASFPLLDAEEVIRQAFGPEPAEKTATVATDYQRAPARERPRNETLIVTPGRDKTAAEDTEYAFRRNYGQAQRLNRDIIAARSSWRNCERELLHKVASLAEYFKRDRTREWLFDEVDYAVTRRHGSLATAVMKAAGDLNGYTVKAANLKPRRAVDWTKTPFTLVADAVKLATEVAAKQSEYISVAMQNRYKIAQLMGCLVNHAPTEPNSVLPQPAEQAFSEKLAFLSGGLSDMALLGSMFNTARGPQPTREDRVGGMVDELNDPAHDEKLRQIRSRAMLHELLNRDEILSSYDPREVMRAYNNLSSLAPRASQQPVNAQSVLRRWATQGGAEPFEAKEQLDIEKGLQTTQQRKSPDIKEASPLLRKPYDSIL